MFPFQETHLVWPSTTRFEFFWIFGTFLSMKWLSCLNLGLLTWEDCCNNWLLHIVLIFVMSGLSINGKHGTKTFLSHCLEYHYLDSRWLTRTWERKITTLAYFFTHAFKAVSWSLPSKKTNRDNSLQSLWFFILENNQSYFIFH